MPPCGSACLAAARGCPRIRFYLMFGFSFGHPPASSGVPALAAWPFGGVIKKKSCAPICRSACLAAARGCPRITFYLVFGLSFGRPPASSRVPALAARPRGSVMFEKICAPICRSGFWKSYEFLRLLWKVLPVSKALRISMNSLLKILPISKTLRIS